MTATTDIVQKLWSLCHVLRDDGITYLQYVTELTYLLFLKMMQETEKEDILPEGYRWIDLVAREGIDQLTFYRTLLVVATCKQSALDLQTSEFSTRIICKQSSVKTDISCAKLSRR